MTSQDHTQDPAKPAEGTGGEDPHGDTSQAQRETLRGEQGTSSGDQHDDSDPQSG
ncbi:hypothetical protein ABZ342_16065 [Amycolatopsis sp. NPDC005961]|uniref:Uncharacterized protein n=1 Tax=Amycolatopsis camponoti TaxID=2606593 RepID=A0A6I8LRY6_9PSEU|nr:hypothetical protein [Amycolatopsis camponoti]VVJ18667.1 Uncharacterised protein [Amycolatopsis camponoti]